MAVADSIRLQVPAGVRSDVEGTLFMWSQDLSRLAQLSESDIPNVFWQKRQVYESGDDVVWYVSKG